MRVAWHVIGNQLYLSFETIFLGSYRLRIKCKRQYKII